jgi:MFS family permease
LRLDTRLALMGALRVLGFSLTMPFVGLALSSYFKEPLSQVSAFYAALAAVSAAGQVLGGVLSDRLGRLRTVVLGGAVASASLAMAFYLWGAEPLEALIVVESLFSNVASVSVTALVGDFFRLHGDLVKAYGRLRVGSNLGWAFGIAAGGGLYALIGFRGLLAVTSALLLLSLTALWGVREPTREASAVVFERPSSAMLLFLVPSFMTFIIAGVMGYPLLQYLTDGVRASSYYAGLALALNGFLVVLFQDAIVRRVGLMEPSRALAVGMALYAVGYALMALVRSYVEALVLIVVVTAGEMVVMPVSSAVAAELSSPRSRGSHMGLYGIAGTLGRNLASAVFAEAVYLGGEAYGWVAISLIAVASSAGYLLALG